MNYLLYIPFGLLPSIVWLLFYLRKDHHPESNKMVLKIFFYGALTAGLAAVIEIGLFKIVKMTGWSSILITAINALLVVAVTEELLKYLVVRLAVLKHAEFDEPIDALLYMIIAALGFAAMENIIILFASETKFFFLETFAFSAFRFISATFLHGLCSGLVGYFLAISFHHSAKRSPLVLMGLFTATLLHGLYNFSIIAIGGRERFIIPAIILLVLVFFLSWGFKKLKRLKSICLINPNI